jgi:hypothetical protein
MSLSSGGNLTISGTLTTSGATTLSSNLVVSNELRLNDNLIVNSNYILISDVNDNAYINFGATSTQSQTGGYGFRANAGTMEYKSKAGSWAAIGSGGGSTTINNNADNRVITGSGTADTLNSESGLTFDGSTLSVSGALSVSGKMVNSFTTNTAISGASTDLLIDFSTASNFSYTLPNGGDITMVQPSNAGNVGQSGNFIIKTGDTSVNDITWADNSHWYFESGTGPTLTQISNVYDIMSYLIIADNTVLITSGGNFIQG